MRMRGSEWKGTWKTSRVPMVWEVESGRSEWAWENEWKRLVESKCVIEDRRSRKGSQASPVSDRSRRNEEQERGDYAGSLFRLFFHPFYSLYHRLASHRRWEQSPLRINTRNFILDSPLVEGMVKSTVVSFILRHLEFYQVAEVKNEPWSREFNWICWKKA